MSQGPYDQYRDALRRGHLAALRGHLDVAVHAYEEAAGLAPDRSLPLASLGRVLQRLGREDAAEKAYGAALERAPSDAAALRGRAELRADLGRRLEAAGDFELLAAVLERADRVADACDAARRALELAESRTRRRTVERLVARLREVEQDPAASGALHLALRMLEPFGGPRQSPADGAAQVPAEPGVLAAPGAAPEPEAPGEPAPAPELDLAARLAEAEARLDAGDVAAARAAFLELSASQRAAGHHDAALDLGLQLLAISPADLAVQLELSASQLVRGWSALVAEKIRLLSRLAELEGDETGIAAIAAFASAHGIPSKVDPPAPSA